MCHEGSKLTYQDFNEDSGESSLKTITPGKMLDVKKIRVPEISNGKKFGHAFCPNFLNLKL